MLEAQACDSPVIHCCKINIASSARPTTPIVRLQSIRPSAARLVDLNQIRMRRAFDRLRLRLSCPLTMFAVTLQSLTRDSVGNCLTLAPLHPFALPLPHKMAGLQQSMTWHHFCYMLPEHMVSNCAARQ